MGRNPGSHLERAGRGQFRELGVRSESGVAVTRALSDQMPYPGTGSGAAGVRGFLLYFKYFCII